MRSRRRLWARNRRFASPLERIELEIEAGDYAFAAIRLLLSRQVPPRLKARLFFRLYLLGLRRFRWWQEDIAALPEALRAFAVRADTKTLGWATCARVLALGDEWSDEVFYSGLRMIQDGRTEQLQPLVERDDARLRALGRVARALGESSEPALADLITIGAWGVHAVADLQWFWVSPEAASRMYRFAFLQFGASKLTTGRLVSRERRGLRDWAMLTHWVETKESAYWRLRWRWRLRRRLRKPPGLA